MNTTEAAGAKTHCAADGEDDRSQGTDKSWAYQISAAWALGLSGLPETSKELESELDTADGQNPALPIIRNIP